MLNSVNIMKMTHQTKASQREAIPGNTIRLANAVKGKC
jgi:hypothetical protein